MSIRPANIDDHDELLAIWLRSVRASHHFLSEADIERIRPQLRDNRPRSGSR